MTEKNKKRNVRPAFGIVNPWPGSMSAEFEVLARIKRAAEENDIDCIMLSNFGHVLDEKQKQTEEFVEPSSVDFVITTHYDSPKTMDSFHYHTLWNPPEIPLNLSDYYDRVTDNYIMNDDFLIYDSGGMSNHLKCMLMNSPRDIEGSSQLVASFPESAMLEPKLDNPMMFYCGMNWERVVHNTNRHEGLFKMLDKTSEIKFFGPDKNPDWGGIAPWEGYNCYQYPIPFDGFSILREINQCGVVLVLSSDIHRRAGAATNRTYEACAAGAVIISDDNDFMMKHFKDAALFITYNKLNPQDTFSQIMEKFNWIKENPDEALKLAKNAQRIFREKFTLDKQLSNIFDNHTERYNVVKEQLFSINKEEEVLVTHVLNTKEFNVAKKNIDQVVKNVKNQTYKNIKLVIVASSIIKSALERYYGDRIGIDFELIYRDLFDIKGARNITEGRIIKDILNTTSCSYYLNTFGSEIWFKDHIDTLIRVLENNEGFGFAYSGRLHEDVVGYRRVDMFGRINFQKVLKLEGMPCAGQVLYRKRMIMEIPDFFFDFIDGTEHYAIMSLLTYKYKKEYAFSKRMTLVYSNKLHEKMYNGLKMDYQQRLIYDSVKYEINLTGTVNDNVILNAKEVLEAFPMSQFPAKAWFKHKYYRYRLSKLKPNSNKYSKFAKKYEDSKQELERIWREECI